MLVLLLVLELVLVFELMLKLRVSWYTMRAMTRVEATKNFSRFFFMADLKMDWYTCSCGWLCCLVKKDDTDPLLVAIAIAIESLTVFRSNDHRLLLVPFMFVLLWLWLLLLLWLWLLLWLLLWLWLWLWLRVLSLLAPDELDDAGCSEEPDIINSTFLKVRGRRMILNFYFLSAFSVVTIWYQIWYQFVLSKAAPRLKVCTIYILILILILIHKKVRRKRETKQSLTNFARYFKIVLECQFRPIILFFRWKNDSS